MRLDLHVAACFSHRSKNICLFIYGFGRVLYTELGYQSQGIDLWYFVSKELIIPLLIGILIHRGKIVDPVSTLASTISYDSENNLTGTCSR